MPEYYNIVIFKYTIRAAEDASAKMGCYAFNTIGPAHEKKLAMRDGRGKLQEKTYA
jgi:hypothetical protein